MFSFCFFVFLLIDTAATIAIKPTMTDTMIHIIYGQNTEKVKKSFSADNKGNSVFNVINEEERICKKYNEWIGDNFCCCIEK